MLWFGAAARVQRRPASLQEWFSSSSKRPHLLCKPWPLGTLESFFATRLNPASNYSGWRQRMPVSQFKLLVVEVDPQLLEARTALLAQNGYEVSAASTLTSALRLFRSFLFDLLVIGPSVDARERT